MPNLKAFLGALSIDGALDLKQHIDATHHLDRNRRQRDFFVAGSLAPRILFDVGHGEERAPRMDPARCLPDWPWLASRQIELVVSVIGVGLQDAGIPRQMRL